MLAWIAHREPAAAGYLQARALEGLEGIAAAIIHRQQEIIT